MSEGWKQDWSHTRAAETTQANRGDVGGIGLTGELTDGCPQISGPGRAAIIESLVRDAIRQFRRAGKFTPPRIAKDLLIRAGPEGLMVGWSESGMTED